MPTSAIIFDFDGIIVDSEPVHGYAIAAAVRTMGMEFRHEEEFHRYIGRGDRECLTEIALQHGKRLTPGELDGLVRAKAAAFTAAVLEGRVLPYAGSVELVMAAAERMPVAVCSGSVREVVEPTLERLGLRGHLRTVVTVNDVTANKPDPAPYLLTARRLGVEPGVCAAIEDSPTGIRAARGAGCRVHGVCHSFNAGRLGEAHHIHRRIGDVSLEFLMNGA